MKKDPKGAGALIVELPEGEESDNQIDADLVGDVVPLEAVPDEEPEEEFIDNPDDVDTEALARVSPTSSPSGLQIFCFLKKKGFECTALILPQSVKVLFDQKKKKTNLDC